MLLCVENFFIKKKLKFRNFPDTLIYNTTTVLQSALERLHKLITGESMKIKP